MEEPTVWARASALFFAAITWLSGEVGRNYIAGAVGGLVRWHAVEGRSLIGGVLAAIGGVAAAAYVSPLYRALLEMIGIQLGEGASTERALAFIAGLSGMTVVKLALALVEAELSLRVRRADRGGREGDDNG